MATATVSRFHPPKPTLFPTHIKRQKTTSYPEVPPRGASAIAANSVRALAWSPLGTQIATGMSTRSIRIWDPEKPRLHVSEFQFRGEKADKLLFHPGGEPEVASVGEDGMVRFWDVRSKGSSGEVKAGGLCFTLAWSPDGKELVVGKKVSTEVFSPYIDYHFFPSILLTNIPRYTHRMTT
jgi:THO complex subunit 3